MDKQPIYFGVRHLSPSGAWHLNKFMDKMQPDIILIEGPSDLNEQMENTYLQGTKPPIAIMAYTTSIPVKTILYPYAVYSPEYQAVVWAHKNNKKFRFIDLPSSVFLAIGENKLVEEDERIVNNTNTEIFMKIGNISGERSHETFWERNFEHNLSDSSYFKAVYEFGLQLREISQESKYNYAENRVREEYMKHQIQKTIKDGYESEKILVVTGAYHVGGLKDSNFVALTEKEIGELPKVEVKSTLMPYSYYRLSQRAGYGAGNEAPAYYEILWNSINSGDLSKTALIYLTKIASYQRKYGNMTSVAEVIEAVKLSMELAKIKGYNIPTLQDLRDSAITCIGHGKLSEIALAVADTEIGTKIGILPDGVSQTSIQDDFYKRLDYLKLNKYKTIVAQDLVLDLRENLRVKSEKSAFLDLERSFFLNRLEVLEIIFAKKQNVRQDKGTWIEQWVLMWSAESEIQLVEATLKGDTIELAAAYQIKEKLDNATIISEVAKIIEISTLCGMSKCVNIATQTLQGMAIDSISIIEIANTMYSLSVVVRYGNIRRVDSDAFIPILQQLFYRVCLILTQSCSCDNKTIGEVIEAIDKINTVSLSNVFLEDEKWEKALFEISKRDDINTKASGFAMAILLDKGLILNEELENEINRRLSKGIPADLGASWFEGLSMKNRYSLIMRINIWEKLSNYLDELDDSEFKRALVFLRRAFSDFTAKEKNDIAENLGEVWKINVEQVSEILNNTLSNEHTQVLAQLEEFDFDDI